jgi:lysozyme family protein
MFNRRQIVTLAIGVSAGALAGGSPALAQGRKLFGIKLPAELDAILPQRALGIAETVDAILTLERDADLKNLPASILSSNSGQPIAATDGSIYELALPRLVALIDRSEFRDTVIAEKAGGLLAQLHARQRVVPDGLRGFANTPPLAATNDDRLFIDAQSAEASLPGIEFPVLAAPIEGAADIPSPAAEPGTVPSDLPASGVPDAPLTDTLPDTLPDAVIESENAPAEPTGEIPPTPTDDSGEPKAKAEMEQDKPLSRRRDFASLSDEYVRLFASATLRPERNEMASWHLKMLRNSRARYEQVAALTGVPWYFIGVTHGLEASFNFRAHLHNGDFPLSRRTRQVPSGRPRIWLPPADWGSSARDALALLGFTGQKDWSLARTLYRLEAYNGLGYRSYGVPTPYLWSFSNHYARGKFVADGRWNAAARSQQCGAAVMLKLLHDAGEIKLV